MAIDLKIIILGMGKIEEGVSNTPPPSGLVPIFKIGLLSESPYNIPSRFQQALEKAILKKQKTELKIQIKINTTLLSSSVRLGNCKKQLNFPLARF